MRVLLDEHLPHRLRQLSKCHPLFGPQFRKVKRRFVFEIRQVSDTLTPNGGVCGDTLVR